MLGGGVVEDHIEHEADVSLISFGDELFQFLHGTEPGIHCAVVGNIITIVTLGAGEEGSAPQQFHTQLLQVVQLGGNALQISFAVSLSRESSFPVGSEVLHICRVRCVDDKPLILDVNYFLKSAVPGLTKEIAENSIYAYLEQELKMQIVTSKRKITVEKATPQDRKLIFMDGYNCLAVVTSNTFNSDGVMFEYTQSRHQPEYFSFHDTATRKKTALNK